MQPVIPELAAPVVSQNFSPTTNETVLDGNDPKDDPRFDTARILWRTGTVFARAAHIYIKDGRKVDPN
jgi:hypothetical protein